MKAVKGGAMTRKAVVAMTGEVTVKEAVTDHEVAAVKEKGVGQGQHDQPRWRSHSQGRKVMATKQNLGWKLRSYGQFLTKDGC